MLFNEYPNMYNINHYNIIEFYQKSIFLFRLECDKIIVRVQDEWYSYKFPHTKKNYKNLDGGNFQLLMNINNYNKRKLLTIKENMKSNYTNFHQIDGVLYSNKNIDCNIEIKKIHIASMKLEHEGFHVLFGWFFRFGSI